MEHTLTICLSILPALATGIIGYLVHKLSLIAGTRTWDEVPASRKPAVKEILEGIAADENNPDHVRAQEILNEINAE